MYISLCAYGCVCVCVHVGEGCVSSHTLWHNWLLPLTLSIWHQKLHSLLFKPNKEMATGDHTHLVNNFYTTLIQVATGKSRVDKTTEYIHTHIHTYTIYTHTQYIYIYTHTYIHTHTHTYIRDIHTYSNTGINKHINACMHA